MLFPHPTATGNAASTSEQKQDDIAFTPIAMPSLAGPGSISVVLSGAEHIRSIRPQDWQIIYVAIIAGMAATLGISLIVLRAASSMVKFLGKGGIDAMTVSYTHLTLPTSDLV